jgi:hypothetical protein
VRQNPSTKCGFSPWFLSFLVLAGALRGSPLHAAGAEVEDPEDATNTVATKASADALGNPKEFLFKTADPAGQRVELIAQLKERHPLLTGLPAESIALNRLADYLLTNVSKLAGDFDPRDHAQRKVDDYTVEVGYGLFNLFRTVEQGILASRIPADFKSALQRFHADEIIGMRTFSRDAEGMVEDFAAVPAGWETAKAGDAASLKAEMNRRCPALAGLDGPARKHALDWIAAVNPCLLAAQLLRSPASRKEGRPPQPARRAKHNREADSSPIRFRRQRCSGLRTHKPQTSVFAEDYSGHSNVSAFARRTPNTLSNSPSAERNR